MGTCHDTPRCYMYYLIGPTDDIRVVMNPPSHVDGRRNVCSKLEELLSRRMEINPTMGKLSDRIQDPAMRVNPVSAITKYNR